MIDGKGCAQVIVSQSLLFHFLQVSSAQTAVQQCSGRSTDSNCLGMRWYLTEAPANHLAHSVSARTRHQQSSAAVHQAPGDISGRFDTHVGLSSLQDTDVLNRSWQPSSTRWTPWSTGTLLRVVLAVSLLCVYFVLLATSY